MKKFFPIIILTLISAFLIFYRFSEVPGNLTFDEVEFTKLSLSLDKKPYIPYSQLATGHSTLFFYIILSSLKIFGINTFALRFPSAIFGILSTLLFYLIIKKIFQKQKFSIPYSLLPTPFIMTCILISSHWFLNFARFSFEATFLLFLELTSIYFLLKFNDDKKAQISIFEKIARGPIGVWRSKKYDIKLFYLILSGLFAGLAFLSYTPGRIFFLLPLGFLLINKRKARDFLVLLIPFIIIITPLTSYLLTNKDTRIDQQFFLNNHEMPVQKKLTGLWNNISTTTLMFNVKGDVNGRHNYPNKPALNPILGILFLIGLITITTNYKLQTMNCFFLFYFLISIIPAMMTYPWENPNMLRTFTVLPSVIYFIGNAIIILYTIVHKIIKNPVLKYLILTTFYLILVFSCFYELRTYFKYQSTVFKQAFEIKLPLEKAIKIKNP